MKYRSKSEILGDCLRTMKGGKTRRMHVMYGARLSTRQLEEYLEVMLEKGMIIMDDRKLASLTPKGLEVLKLLDTLAGLTTKIMEETAAETPRDTEADAPPPLHDLLS